MFNPFAPLHKHATFATAAHILDMRNTLGIDTFDQVPDGFARLNKMLGSREEREKLKSEIQEGARELVKSGLLGGYTDAFRDAIKSLEANPGTATNISEYVGGSALMVQSLESTLIALISSSRHLKFLNTCARQDVFSTLNEYTRHTSHSHFKRPTSARVAQVGEPGFDNAVLEREHDPISFYSTGFSTDRVLPLVKTIEDGFSVQTRSGMMRILANVTYDIFYGNRNVQSLAMHGFKAILEDKGLVLDARGKLPDVDAIQNLAVEIATGPFGQINCAWMHPAVRRAWDRHFLEKDAVRLNYGNQNIITDLNVGETVQGINAAEAEGGKIPFKTDPFLAQHADEVPLVYDPTTKGFIEGPDGFDAPDMPTECTVSVTAAPITGSRFYDYDVNGQPLRYRIVACSDTGRSRASDVLVTSAAITAGFGVNIDLKPARTGLKVDHYEIFRETRPGSGVIRYMTAVKADPSGAVTSYMDLNHDRPGTGIMLVGDFNSAGVDSLERTYALGMLLPPLRTKFAAGVKHLREEVGMIEMYCGFMLKAPEKFRLIKGIPTADQPR